MANARDILGQGTKSVALGIACDDARETRHARIDGYANQR